MGRRISGFRQDQKQECECQCHECRRECGYAVELTELRYEDDAGLSRRWHATAARGKEPCPAQGSEANAPEVTSCSLGPSRSEQWSNPLNKTVTRCFGLILHEYPTYIQTRRHQGRAFGRATRVARGGWPETRSMPSKCGGIAPEKRH